VFADTPPIVAVMVVVPEPVGVAAPFVSTIATVTSDDVHTTWGVIVSLLPSLKCPTALNCCVPPRAAVGVAGVSRIDVRVAPVIVACADPTTPFNTAPIVAVPCATPIAPPKLPGTLLIIATDADEDVQVTDGVRSCVVPSCNVPVAVKRKYVPAATVSVAGVIAIAVTGSTVMVAVADCPPRVAVMVVVPALIPVMDPCALIVATVVSELCQATSVPTVTELPSL